MKTLHGNIEQNFMEKIDHDGPLSNLGTRCWTWISTKINTGYGAFWNGSTNVLAHRYAYQMQHGPIGNNQRVDHRCGNRSCVNPAHLRLATDKQNNENRTALNSNNKSGIRGVHWSGERRKWIAQVGHEGKRINVGRFDSIEDAEAAVIAKRNELFTHNDRDRIA